MEWNWWLILYIIVAIPYIWRLFLQYFLTISSMSCIKLRSYLKHLDLDMPMFCLTVDREQYFPCWKTWLIVSKWLVRQIFCLKWKPHGLSKANKFSAHPSLLNILKVHTWYFFLQHSIWRPLLENELKTKSTALENHWRSQESKIFGGRQLWVVSSPLTVFSRC